MQYRRAFVPGGTFFFTVVTARRRPIFADEKAVELLRQAFRHVNVKRPFTVDAMVVLPDHLHCLWTLPPEDGDYPIRWRLIKTQVTKCLVFACDRRSNRTIWQARYWEHPIRSESDYRQHVEYIHYNPVKHGYVRAPSDWPYSSFMRFVGRGIHSADWGSTEPLLGRDVGRE